MSLKTYRGFGAGQDSIARRGFASYTGLPQPPPAGYQYTVCTSTSFAGLSLQQGSFPFVVVGDIFITQLVTSPSGYPIQVNGDGTLQIVTGGDTSRQSFQYFIYRVASNSIDGPATIWDHEVAPSWATPIFLINQVVGVPIAPINLASPTYATSSSGDALTFAVASGALPPGIGLGGGVLSGTPLAFGTFNFTISAMDNAGISTPSPTSQITVLSGGAIIIPASVPVGPQADILSRLQQLMPHGWFH